MKKKFNNTIIIAEIGVNHNGDLYMAKQLIDIASNAGADIVKFQTFKANKIVTKKLPKVEYQKQQNDSNLYQYEMLQKLEINSNMHDELIAYCNTKKIEFMSTGFDLESIKYLDTLGVRRFKIPSGEITHLKYLRLVGSLGKPIFLSTGMSTLGEIEAALEVLDNAGTPREQITVLHCNTDYPTSMEDVNLLAMVGIRQAFGINVGYSDHTLGIEIPIAAVTLGAKVIEKHITLDRNLPGPDHLASTEPKEFYSMVKSIRKIEQALGDGIKRPTLNEIKKKDFIRKSLVASKFIKLGEKFTEENITAKRAGKGICPMRLYDVIGQRASRSFEPDDLIFLN